MANRLCCIAIYSSFVLVVACASAPPAERANADGNGAYLSGKFNDALSEYEQALKLATDSGDKQYAAIAMYGLARTNARLCNVPLAEDWFKKSIAARESLPDERSAYLTQNLLEFARFLLAQGRVAEGVLLMDRAVPRLEWLGVAGSDPIAYANFYDDYAVALREVGRAADAAAASSRADTLRSHFPDRKARFKPATYADCRTRK